MYNQINYINTNFGVSVVDIPFTILTYYFIKNILYIKSNLSSIYLFMKFEIRFIIELFHMSLEILVKSALLNLQPTNAIGKLF